MLRKVYRKALSVYGKRPFKYWGITLLLGLITTIAWILFGIIPGVVVAASYIFTVGLAYIYLCGYNGEAVKASDLFVGFTEWKTAKRVMGGMAWRDLIIFLWCLIPLVGWVFAIIRSYSYALTPYILIKEPEIKATEAIKVSEARMKGNRGKMFAADIVADFVYAFIVLIGFIFVALAVEKFLVISIVLGVIVAAFAIVGAISLPLYHGIVRAGFYAEIMAEQAEEADAE